MTSTVTPADGGAPGRRPPTCSHRRPHGVARGRAVFVVGLVAVGGLLAACAGATTTTPDASAAMPALLPTPLATSVRTAGGEWATVPMGHLGDPTNTFWQLLVDPQGSTRWSDDVAATAVATNGGIVLATSGPPAPGPDGPAGADDELLAGLRPSDLLRYSPLVASSDTGRSWNDGLLVHGLADSPGALALGGDGRALALVTGPGGPEVLTDVGGIGDWRVLTTMTALAASPGGRRCRPRALTAVGYLGANPVVAGACARGGVVGLFVDGAGTWHLGGPSLPTPVAGDGTTVEVLGLRPQGAGLAVLLAALGRHATDLLGAWQTGGGRWTVGPPLPVVRSGRPVSFGEGVGSGLFVLLEGSSGEERLVTVMMDSAWHDLPAPPAGTATVVFSIAADASASSSATLPVHSLAGPSDVQAIVVHGSRLAVWTLATPSGPWERTQVTNIPIEYGSSS